MYSEAPVCVPELDLYNQNRKYSDFGVGDIPKCGAQGRVLFPMRKIIFQPSARGLKTQSMISDARGKSSVCFQLSGSERILPKDNFVVNS